LFYIFSNHTFDFSAKKNFGTLKPPHENFLRMPLPVIVTVTKRVLLSSTLPVPRSKADENSNHNQLIIEENSFTVQLTFSDGNCGSSIYLLAFHLCFVSKTLSFCLQITCIHVC